MPGLFSWFIKERAQNIRVGGADRRVHKRYVVTNVTVVLFGNRENVYDISMGGLCIKPYDGGLEPGSVFSFDLELKLHGRDAGVKLPCRGKVARRMNNLLAIKYVAMNDPLKRNLQDFIRRFEKQRPEKKAAEQ